MLNTINTKEFFDIINNMSKEELELALQNYYQLVDNNFPLVFNKKESNET